MLVKNCATAFAKAFAFHLFDLFEALYVRLLKSDFRPIQLNTD